MDELMTWLWPALFVVAGFLVGVVIDWMILRRLRGAASRTDWGWDDLLIDAIGRAPVLWFTAAGVYAALESLTLPSGIRDTLQAILVVVVILSLTLVASRIAANAVRLLTERSAGGLPGMSLIQNITRVVVFGLGLLIILQQLGIRITPVIGALGVGSLAVALALQDTLSNLFAGFQIILTRQVEAGDFIRLEGGEQGYVTDVQWRNTTVKSRLDESETVIPNRKLADSVVTNFTLPRKPLWVRTEVGVSYGSDLDQVERVTLEVAREVAEEFSDDGEEVEPVLRFRSFGDSSVELMVRVHVDDYGGQFRVKHELVKRIHARYREEGIVIPFPIRTLDVPGALRVEGAEGRRSEEDAPGDGPEGSSEG